jgi:hypothetical protein
MRNFHRIADGIAVLPLMHALMRNPQLWNENSFRTEFPNTPHGDVDDIWLRFSDPEKCTTTSNVIGDDKPIWYPAASILSDAKPIILNLMRGVNAYELGRVLITRLRPGGKILPHRDDAGEYVNMRDIARYHVVLQGLPGSLYHCGNETVCMRTGEVWWFNAHELHAVENGSAEDRIHLLVDVRTW